MVARRKRPRDFFSGDQDVIEDLQYVRGRIGFAVRAWTHDSSTEGSCEILRCTSGDQDVIEDLQYVRGRMVAPRRAAARFCGVPQVLDLETVEKRVRAQLQERRARLATAVGARPPGGVGGILDSRGGMAIAGPRQRRRPFQDVAERSVGGGGSSGSGTVEGRPHRNINNGDIVSGTNVNANVNLDVITASPTAFKYSNVRVFEMDHFPKRPALDLAFEDITYTVTRWKRWKFLTLNRNLIIHGLQIPYRPFSRRPGFESAANCGDSTVNPQPTWIPSTPNELKMSPVMCLIVSTAIVCVVPHIVARTMAAD
ncbi:hypothetical protein AAG570_003699 [Ranatra chinensis]|uniref:Uncharacterized protein n=1 Tax=Ranatra chinensis TaxID=642074 RepID=A0ABD0YSX5_9HEMI